MAFRIIRNDITLVRADAIVNTANPNVAIGDGVDSAIYEAAGKEKLLLARKEIGYLNVGEVGITSAFDLPAMYIIHSSGPRWIDGKQGEAQLLRQCYDKALELAYKYQCRSIAFPLMSTGTYGFPKELGLQIALEAFNAFLLEHEMEISLVVFGENAYKVSGKIFEEVREYVDNNYVRKKLKKEYRHDGIPSVCSTVRMDLMAVRTIDDYSDAVELCEEDASAVDMPEVYRQKSNGTFGEYLQQMIHKKGMKNSEVYTAANLTKQYFSKVLNGKVAPSKVKIMSLAVALRLNMDETIDFLRMSGYAFSPFSEVDKVFEYFIRNQIYDIYRIDIVLFDCGLPTLISE